MTSTFMRTRHAAAFFAAAAWIGFSASMALAQRSNANQQSTHSGIVVETENNQLTMRGETGESTHAHTINNETQITRDGQQAELDDLQRGDRIRVTTRRDAPGVALRIDATRDNRSREGAANRTESAASDRGGEQPGEAGLGVIASETRDGDSVYVRHVYEDSPAERAGIREGDYIMSVGEEDIETPDELTEAVTDYEPGSTAEITIWRDGTERTVRAKFATRAQAFDESDEAPSRRLVDRFRRFRGQNDREAYEGQTTSGTRQEGARDMASNRRAWLGVTLGATDDDEGVRVTRVTSGGPAERAGIRVGDILLRVAGSEVTSPDEVAEMLGQMDPNRRVDLTIRRDDDDRRLAVTLGQPNEARRGAAERQDADQYAGTRDARGQYRRGAYDEQAGGQRSHTGAGHQGRHSSDEIARLTQQNQRLERMVQQLGEDVQELQSRVNRIASDDGDDSTER